MEKMMKPQCAASSPSPSYQSRRFRRLFSFTALCCLSIYFCAYQLAPAGQYAADKVLGGAFSSSSAGLAAGAAGAAAAASSLKRRTQSLRHLLSNSPLSSTAGLAATADSPHNIIEVSVPSPQYGAPVHSQQILQHNFGVSWGSPAVVNYTAPLLNSSSSSGNSSAGFNKVLVSFNATSFGVQYDRLCHFFMHDIPVWRPSTAEPGGQNISFGYVKDLSDYVDLFKKDGYLSFELDNNVDGSINGEFNVTLTAYYYNYPPDQGKNGTNALGDGLKDDLFQSIAEDSSANTGIFDVTNKAPSKIVPIVSTADPSSIPLKSFPETNVTYSAEKLSPQTIRAKLRLFVSGNADEEFWYTNVLDPYVDKFSKEGTQLIGKGPVRVVKVYLNDRLISVQVPPPVIYTGGISPSLWNPVVGLNAFDVRPIDVDVTTYLPLLWQNQSTFRIEVVASKQSPDVQAASASTSVSASAPSSLASFSYGDAKQQSQKSEQVQPSADDGDSNVVYPGNNWLITGSLLTWENQDIISSSGTVSFDDHNKNEYIVALGQWDPSSLKQMVSYNEYVRSTANFSIQTGLSNSTNDNGYNNTKSDLEFSFQYYSEVKVGNVQSYTNYGAVTDTASSVQGTTKITLLDNNSSKSTVTKPVQSNDNSDGDAENDGDNSKSKLEKTENFCNSIQPKISTASTHGKDVSSNLLSGETNQEFLTVVSINTTTIDSNKQDLNVTIIQADNYGLQLNNAKTFNVNKRQNGTSTFYMDSANGNHGTSSTETTVKVQEYPADGVFYKRKVQTKENSITSDTVTQYQGAQKQKVQKAEDSIGMKIATRDRKNRVKHRKRYEDGESGMLVTKDDLMKLSELYCRGQISYSFLQLFYTKDYYNY